ncbi:helix-turn-helix domain-containing protein [Sphingobium yanoikuyae]|uniref:helix-turn-helix domain-containing protein n=1 Tax=Sphingobium yanoikuyae TaxID=13690 RepID=UPI0026EB6F8D|nr:helix-turn-helix domain-containing protein [Sphingobium yanoikuyae]
MNAVVVIEGDLCSMNEAARALGMSYYEVYNLSSSGQIGRVKRGRRVFVPACDVRAMLDQRRDFSKAVIGNAIATMPEDRKDGRDVLVWAGFPAIASWCDGWRDAVGHELAGVTHWADLEGPGL